MSDVMAQAKAELRLLARAARKQQCNPALTSAAVLAQALAHPRVQHAQCVLWYVSQGSEVQTLHALSQMHALGHVVVIPYCTTTALGAPALGLWQLNNLAELVPGAWGILEPPAVLWQDPKHYIQPQQLDAVLVPGLAFAKTGARLGNGAGYYDRLLPQTRPDCVHIGIAYACQIFPEVPMNAYDQTLHAVATETTLWQSPHALGKPDATPS